MCVCFLFSFIARNKTSMHDEEVGNLGTLCRFLSSPRLVRVLSSFLALHSLGLFSISQEAYVDSAALAESKLELQEERAAQGLSTEPTPAFEVEEVDDWEVGVGSDQG